MTKRQVYQLLAKIAAIYPGKHSEISQEKIDLYVEELQDYHFRCVDEMWQRYYAAANKYPPTLADLIPTVPKEPPSEVYSAELVKWSNNAARLEDVEAIIHETKRKLNGEKDE
jgi:Loader and inhibitor of phage G40P